MITPLHLLAYALSPRYYSAEVLAIPGRVAPYRDVEVTNGNKRAFDKIFCNPNVGVTVRREFGSFISGRDLHPTAINDQSRMHAIRWRYLHGKYYVYLQPLISQDPKYKEEPEKLWDVAPKSTNLDMTIRDLARATLADVDDDDDDETIPSSASGTYLGSNDDFDQLLAVTGDPIDPDFFDNPFDV